MSAYTDWKANVTGKSIADRQCMAAIRDYLKSVYPDVNPYSVLPSVVGAKDLAGKGTAWAQWIANNHTDVNQLPVQGDIMVFGATPANGYTNKTNNSYGHAGVCDSANSNGYYLTQQNAPHDGSPMNTTYYDWKYRPCLGWFRVGNAQAPQAAPAAQTSNQTSIRVNPGTWNVRTSPSTTASIIKQDNGNAAPALGGQQYSAVIDSNGWAQISFTGNTGYLGPKSYTRI